MNKLRYFRVAFAVAGLAFFCSRVVAQVPQLINYQGRVAVGDLNFNGTGKFKFALVDGSGTTTYWSNDGTSAGAGEPTTFVSINVTNGLYSVLLGNTAQPAGMTGIPATVFNNADVRLRVWFDDGVHGFQMLTPDERIAAVGYAMKAAFASTVSDGAITADKIAGGAVIANLNASGQGGVPSGGLILSLTENAALVSAGYVRIGTATMSGFKSYAWQAAPPPTSGTPPSPREFYSMVWTGTEMIIWGGSTDGFTTGAVNTGGRYNPTTNTWTPVTTIAAPTARIQHTAVWTGSEMIVWGGDSGTGVLNDGGRYNPATDTWAPVSANSAPTARRLHTAVWTGNKMIVWGGENGAVSLNDGGLHDPVNNTWTSTTGINAPAGRILHTAIWTGSNMIIWGGGENASGALDSGGRYNPATDSWAVVTAVDAPVARRRHTALWTGSRMIVWGGYNTDSGFRSDGARYNPATDSWQVMSNVSAPQGRYRNSTVWTGSEMIVWGGFGGPFLNTGGRYDPAVETWSVVPLAGAPIGREDGAAVWTGSRMILWGGAYSDGSRHFLNDMWFLNSAEQTMYLYQKP